MKSILFVCLGNICRSPMAEAVFKEKVKRVGMIEEVTVRSAATSSFEIGSPPHKETQKILRANAISFGGITATQITTIDFIECDWIIGMDHQNCLTLKQLAPKKCQKKIHLFMELVPESEQIDVPDPYYTGDFDTTYQLIDQGTDAWLQLLQSEKGASG